MRFWNKCSTLSFSLICGIRCRKAEAFMGYSRTAIGYAKILGSDLNTVLITFG